MHVQMSIKEYKKQLQKTQDALEHEEKARLRFRDKTYEFFHYLSEKYHLNYDKDLYNLFCARFYGVRGEK